MVMEGNKNLIAQYHGRAPLIIMDERMCCKCKKNI